jgi:hypothetical protein
MINLRCPICQKVLEVEKASDLPSLPFCSERCRTIDLGRWLGGQYGIPLGPDDKEEGTAPDDEPVP